MPANRFKILEQYGENQDVGTGATRGRPGAPTVRRDDPTGKISRRRWNLHSKPTDKIRCTTSIASVYKNKNQMKSSKLNK